MVSKTKYQTHLMFKKIVLQTEQMHFEGPNLLGGKSKGRVFEYLMCLYVCLIM